MLVTTYTRMMLKNTDLSPAEILFSNNLSHKIKSGDYLLSKKYFIRC